MTGKTLFLTMLVCTPSGSKSVPNISKYYSYASLRIPAHAFGISDEDYLWDNLLTDYSFIEIQETLSR